MNRMEIFIPSKSRAALQTTLAWIPDAWLKATTFVVPKGEAKAYRSLKPTVAIAETPVRINGIGPTRQWILERAKADRVCMLDDDLSFYLRRKDEPAHFLPATSADVDRLFKTIAATLTPAAPHIGVCPREGGNYIVNDLRCTRMLRVLAYHVPTYFALRARYDRLEFMEDFDVTLQLLRAGKPNVLLAAWAQGQKQSNAPGGCSTYRSLERQAAAARALAALHAPYVKVVEKTTKTAWGGATRTDVVISWKKAFLSSGKEL